MIQPTIKNKIEDLKRNFIPGSLGAGMIDGKFKDPAIDRFIIDLARLICGEMTRLAGHRNVSCQDALKKASENILNALE